MRHISFRRTGATLNRASSFPRPQFSVYFIYTFTESESRIWPQLALNQRSWTIAFGLPPDTFVCPAQYFANLNVNVFVVGHIFLRALQTLHMTFLLVAHQSGRHTGAPDPAPSHIWVCNQPCSLDADGWFWWHVGSWGGDVKNSFGIQTGKELEAAEANTSQVSCVGSIGGGG